MYNLHSCLNLLFCIALQGSPSDEAKFRIERPLVSLQPTKQAILVNPEGSPVVFRLNIQNAVPGDTRIRAELIGPSLTTPVVIDQSADQAVITLPRTHFMETGIYELSNIRLESGGTILNFATPQTAEIQVSEEFVVTEVAVEPLSEKDLLDLGYVFHPEDYVAVSFQLGLSIETKPERVDVNIPVVFPRHENSTFRPQVLRDPFSTFHISPIIIPSPDGPNPEGDPILPPTEEINSSSPLMGLLLIPGQLKYLKSHFAVTCVLMNVAPDGYSVRATDMTAELRLPLATTAGLPLTIQEPTRQVMVNLGRDGTPNTADDSHAVDPGQKARAKYVITGNVPGFHNFEVLVQGDLHLPQGKEPFSTRTKASVYVRSPDYNLSFEHPDAVEEGENYDLLVRVANTGQIAMEGFQLLLDGDRLQGVRLADGQYPVQDLGTIPIGAEATATYQLRSQVTGKVVAGYVKINDVGQMGEGVELRVAVGDIGQRISPYTLHFAQEFFDRFPADLTDALKRHAKKALDTSMTADHELPADLMPTTSKSVRAMNRAFVRAAKGQDFGMTPQESLIHLFREWVHPKGDYQPLDRIRRKILNLNELPLETAFGGAFDTAFSATAKDFLTQIAQENIDIPNLHLFAIDASGPVNIVVNGAHGTMTSDGQRDLSFASMLPVSSTRTLIWCSKPDDLPKLVISPDSGPNETITITGLSTSGQESNRWLFQSDLTTVDRDLTLTLNPNTRTAQLRTDQRPTVTYAGGTVPVKPFELVSIAQVHRTRFGEADHLGRHHRLYFSAPVDLSSFYPLEEHLTLNGEPIVFGELQADERTLIVTSKMPLGPYHPIAYRLHDVAGQDGQTISTEEGTYPGSASYRGVSIAGRVADRMGTDLTKARAFLWVLDRVLDPEDPAFTGDDELLVPRIVHTLHPDVEGRWTFDFAPTIPETDQRDSFFFQTIKVGVVLQDGRYQERTFRPQGAGQTIAAEFAFFQLGTVQGQVTSGGSPIPFTKVFVTSEDKAQSAAIVETDANGFYRASDIQVGQVLVKAANQSQVGLIGGFLTAYNNPLVLDLDVATPSANFVGAVTESVNGVTMPLAEVLVGYVAEGRSFNRIGFQRHNVSAKFIAIAKTDENGQYNLNQMPSGQGEMWFYHYDYGLATRAVVTLEGETQTVDYQFQFFPPDTGTVSGYVEDINGQRLDNVRVSVGLSVTHSDSSGYFELDHIAKNKPQRIYAYHSDWGSGELGLFLEQDVLTNQTIVLYGSVPISGLYLDANGDPVPFAPVYMSYLKSVTIGGFHNYSDFAYFGQTDFAGQWEGRGPKETVYRFTGYDPPQHAYASDITVGPLGVENLTLQKSGLTDLRVRLIDADGTPVVAKVDLKTLVPSAELPSLGRPDLVTTHQDIYTDENGYATFTGISTGDFEVFGHLEELGQTEVYQGLLSQTPPGDPQTVTLAFPPDEETANLFGTIYQPGGTDPAPDGTIVRLKGPGVNAYVIATLAGTYRFENLNLGPDPTRLELVAYNPDTQHFYRQWLDLNQDLNFKHDLILRKRMSVVVSVEYADGEPAPFAEVHADFLNVNHDPGISSTDLIGDDILAGYIRETGQITPEESTLTLTDVPSGPLVLRAISGNGLAGLKRIALPLDRDMVAVTLRLETASQISGRFVDDLEAPITAAPVALKQRGDWLHQVLSSENPGQEGTFLFDGLPMGRYDLEGVDPATARRAHLAVTTSPFQPAPDVILQLDPVTSLTGLALFQGQPVPNTTLKLRGKHFQITTGTDANGRFRFANLPLGHYNIRGQAASIPSRIFDEIQLSQADTTITQDLNFGEVRDLQLNLIQPDGAPVSDVLLSVYRGVNENAFPVASSAYTDENGIATLSHLPLGSYRVMTERLNDATAVYQTLAIHEADNDPTLRTIQLAGTGSLQGRVTDSLGQPIGRPVHVRIAIRNVHGVYKHRTITTSEDGSYRLGNVPVGHRIEVAAYHPVTHEADHSVLELDLDGEVLVHDLSFHATTYASGQVLLPGGSPAAYAVVWTESPLRNQTRTDEFGQFHLEPILDGDTEIFVEELSSSRRASLPITISSSSGIQLDPATDLELTLGGVAEVYGTIAFDAGDPTRFGSVRLENQSGGVTQEVRIQGDGAFVFPRVPLGDYQIIAYTDRFGVETSPLPLTLDMDQASVQQNHFFDPNYSLSGTVFAPNHVDPVPGATISLWRPRTERAQDGYERIYEDSTDASGMFQIDNVFPGPYLLKVSNPDATASWTEGTFFMPNNDHQENINLETVIPLTGTLADASERPFANGQLTILQDGQTTRLPLDPQGGFGLSNLRPTPYQLDYSLAGGWIEGSMTVNQPTADPVSLRTVDTVTLTGRAILANSYPPYRPAAYLVKDGIARRLSLAADGGFSLSRVPVNEPIQLDLRYSKAHRIFDLGSFTADTDLGDFYLDAIKPDMSFPADGQAVTTLPLSLQFLIAEDEPDSDIDPTGTQVWVNGKGISSQFTTSQTSITANFDLLPEGFLIGANEIKVRVYNTSDVFREATYNLDLNLAGPSLVVDLQLSGDPIAGQVQLDDGPALDVAADGRTLFHNIEADQVRLKGQSLSYGKRQYVEVGPQATQFIQLNLHPIGSYHGQVLSIDGTPVPNITIHLNDSGDYEKTDANGNYIFDLLPLDEHELWVNDSGQFGFLEGPAILNSEQAFLNQDIQLDGLGTVTGTVYDDDGLTPVPNAEITLEYTDLPSSYPKPTTTADSQGVYLLEDVLTRDFRITAQEPGTSRSGQSEDKIALAGDTLTVDVELAPNTTLTGTILGLDGQPAVGAVIDLLLNASSGDPYQQLTVDETGVFTFSEIPRAWYTLKARRDSHFEYLDVSLNLHDQPLYDIGNQQMVLDQPPQDLAVIIPDPFHPAAHRFITVRATDDFEAAHWSLTLSNAYQEEFTGIWGPRNLNAHIDHRIPHSTPDGTLHYRLEVWDNLEQSSVIEGDVALSSDTFGPQVSIIEPLDQAAVWEGQAIPIEVEAIDPSGIASIVVRLDGVTIGSESGYFETSESFDFTATVPDVAVVSLMPLSVDVTDQEGNLTTVDQTIEVQPILTSGAPQVTVLGPLPNQPLPLWLPQGLTLHFAADAGDPDGLGTYDLAIDGQVVLTGTLGGQTDRLEATYTLPIELRDADSLTVSWAVRDLGGNAFTSEYSVENLDGNWLVKSALDPLELPPWYQSPPDERHVILAGGEHIIDGSHTLDQLVLVNGAVVTQSPSTAGDAYVASTDIQLTDLLLIDFGSQIDVDGKGYLDLPLSLNLGAGKQSHGGLAKGTSNLNQIYGSPFQPVHPGSHEGGGAIAVHASDFWLLGTITANAVTTTYRPGSGGSIWVTATDVHGEGRLEANGFAGAYAESNTDGGGGGRIAIEAPDAFIAQAYGGKNAGAGTVFRRIPDAMEADGYLETLTVANHPDATTTNQTFISTRQDLLVGTDVTVDIDIIDNETRQVVQFVDPSPLPPGNFLGMRVFTDGNYDSSTAIAFQTSTSLQSAHQETFGVFSNGDLIRVDYKLDDLIVRDMGWFVFDQTQPTNQIEASGGRLSSSGTPIDLSDLAIAAGETVDLRGDFQTNSVNVAGTLILDGTLSTGTLDIPATGLVKTPTATNHAALAINFTNGVIGGLVLADSNGLTSGESTGFEWSHGGLGQYTQAVAGYGSLYRPETPGNSSADFGGGQISLQFQNLDLTGVLDVTPRQEGSAGSILLEGDSLSGDGQLLARGGPNKAKPSGGGRIAILVDNIDTFTGTTSTQGTERYDSSYDYGGAGTAYYRTNTWPNGRLVIDNEGFAAPTGSTLLPGIGDQTVPSPTGGARLDDDDLPPFNSLVDMYVTVDGFEPVQIQDQDNLGLIPVSAFPNLNVGASYGGLHRLDVLEVRNGAKLRAIDPIELTQQVIIENAEVDAEVLLPTNEVLADGTGELSSDPGWSSLELDNYQLTVDFPLDLDQLTLRNGSSLTYRQPVQATAIDVEAGSTLLAAVDGSALGLTAGSLTIRSGATWTVADRKPNGEAFQLHANIAGSLNLEAGGLIITSGANKVQYAIPIWAGVDFNSKAHGGLPNLNHNPDEIRIAGSFADPAWPGNPYGGGVINIEAGEIILDGHIKADGESLGTGGSVRLTGTTISGSGEISAEPGGPIRGGGRIAIYYGTDSSFLETISFSTLPDFVPTSPGSVIGAGSVFAKGTNQTHGDLIIDQQNRAEGTSLDMAERFWLSGITGLKDITLALDDSDPDPLVIRDNSWTQLPPGLTGLTIEADIGGMVYRSKILANTHDSLNLASPFPNVVTAGTELKFILELDNLILRNGAQMHFPGVIELSGQLILEGDHLTSLSAQDLIGLPTTWTLSDRDFRLNLDEPTLDNLDLQLQQANLYLDRAITFRDVTLTDSWFQHSPWTGEAYETRWPYLDVTLRNLVADTNSGFDVSKRVDHRDGADGYGSPRPNGGITYGSLFQPSEFGSGSQTAGGRIRVRAEQIDGGKFLSQSDHVRTGGSIWIDAQTLAGTVEVDAGLTDRVSGAAGRIAIYYGDASQANLTTTAYGTGAGGTVFIKNHADPLGDLTILGDNLPPKGSYKTSIPHFAPVTLGGSFSAIFDTPSNATDLIIPGLITDTDWTGYRLVLNGDLLNPIPIVGSSFDEMQTTFTLSGDLSGLLSGDTLQLAVEVDRLDISAGTYLDLGDLLLLYNKQYPTNHVFLDGDGAFLEPPQTADNRLVLDQFNMVLHSPANYDQIELRNGATLTVQVSGNSQTPVLTGTDLTVTDGLAIADHFDFSGSITVGINGKIEAYTDPQDFFAWPPGTPIEDPDAGQFSYGGIGEIESSNGQLSFNPTYGSFTQPWEVGRYRRALKLVAGSLHVDGVVSPDLDYESFLEEIGGGALWIDTGSLSGSGTIHVNTNTSIQNYNGGGRIALYYTDMTAWLGDIEAFSRANNNVLNYETIYRGRGGSGTVFLKRGDQTYGDLHVTGSDKVTIEGSTALVGLGRRPLGSQVVVAGQTLTDPDQIFPFSLAGLHLVYEDNGSTFETAIVSNTPHSITVADPLPDLQPGDEIRGRLHLDNLVLEKGAQLQSPDHVVIHGGLQFGTRGQEPATLWARALSLPTQTFTIQDQAGGLAIEETTNLTDLTLDNSELLLDLPIEFTQLNLVNGTVISHRAARDGGYRRYAEKPAVTIQADTIQIDATSAIDVIGKGYPDDSKIEVEEMWGIGDDVGHGHGGNAFDMESGYAYGTPFQPESYGFRNGGGRIHLIADQIVLEGRIDASGNIGGSIWLDVGTATGDGAIKADGGLPGGPVGTGGRIAVYFDSNLLTQMPQATSPVVDHGGSLVQYGAGTVYLFDQIAQLGTLILYNQNQPSDVILPSPIVGIGDHTLASAPLDPQIIQVPGANWRYSLAGHKLVDTATGTTYKVISNTEDTLVLDQPVVPSPTAGWAFHGEPPVDGLEIMQAEIASEDTVIDRIDPTVTSVEVTPLVDGKLTGGLPFNVAVEADDNFELASVSVTFDGQTLQATQPPWSFSMTAPTPSQLTNYDLVVTATDTSGLLTQVTETLPVETSDSNPPVITFVAPAANAEIGVVKPFDVMVQVADEGLVDTIEVSFNGQSQTKTLTAGEQGDNHTFSFTTPFVLSDTSMVITVTATDGSGNPASDTRNVTVTIVDQFVAFPKPVAYFTLDEADRDGDELFDMTRRHIGKNDGATPNQIGQIGESYNFNYDLVEIPNTDDLNVGGQSFTVSIWVNPINQAYTNARILEKTAADDDDDWRMMLKLQDSSGQVRFAVTDGQENDAWVTDPTPLQENTWSHVVGVSDGQDISLYVNGALVDTAPWPYTLGDTSAPLYLGGSSVNSKYLRADLDEVGLWRDALTPDQVALLYQFGNHAVTPDFEPPEEVTDMVVTTTVDEATLSWQTSANTAGDLAGYRIYRDGQLVVDNLTPANTQWIGTGLTAATHYQWRISAFDSNDNESIGILLGSFTLDAQSLNPAISLPVAGWSLDLADISGDQVADNFATFDGTLRYSYTGEVGKIGEAILFSTDDDRVVISSGDLLDDLQDNDYSLAAWYKPEATPTNANNAHRHHAILMKRGKNVGLYYTNEQKFQMAHHLSNGDTIFLVSRYRYTPGTYHHIAATVDRSNGTARLYVDGALHDEKAFTPDATAYNYGTQSWRIGEAGPSGHTYRFPANGTIDEPKLWDRALSADEIAALFQSENSGQPWDFTPPEDASQLQFTVASDNVTLSWTNAADPQGDRAGYFLWVDDAATPIELSAVATSTTVNGLQASTLVDFRLSAFDHSHNESAGISTTLHTLATDNTLPSLPQPLTHWRLDSADNDGTTILDVANGHDGQINGAPTVVSGIVSEGLNFSDDDDAVVIPNHADLEDVQEGDYTLSAWFKPDGLPSNSSSYYRHYGLVMKQGYSMGLYYTYEGKFGMTHRLSNEDIFIFTGSAPPDLFHQVTAVVNQTAGTVRIYLNGILQEEATYSPSATVYDYGTTPWRLGEAATSSSSYRYPAKGILDEVFLWDQALSREEVTILHQTTHNGQTPNYQKTASLQGQKPGPTQVDDLRDRAIVQPDGKLAIIDQFLSLNDYTDLEDVVLIGSRLELQGRLTLGSLVLNDGSLITPSSKPGASPQPVYIRLEGGLVIERGSGISLDGYGHGFCSDRLSHGGIGTGDLPTDRFDSHIYPIYPGGGPSGGGALIIEANTIGLDGFIQSRGIGFSAGGAIQLHTTSLYGNGVIDVDGGREGSAIGGGGRIAIHSLDWSDYLGQIILGQEPDHSGSLYLDGPARSGLPIFGHFPTQFNLPLPLTVSVHPVVYVTDVYTQARDSEGVRWDIASPQDLRHLTGLTLWVRGQTHLVSKVTTLDTNRFILHLEGDPPPPDDRPFILLIEHSDQFDHQRGGPSWQLPQ